MLQVQQLHQYYGGSHILRGLSFEAKVGEVTCLLGRNGVGKTTLLKCLMGLIPAKEGAVNWEGKPITGFKPHQRVHAGIAYVPQGREIFGRLTVEENLLMGLSRFSAREAKEVPEFIYELFPVLQEMKHRRGGDLSGGQQQQLAIGRALASKPRLLILDEPLTGLDAVAARQVKDLLLAHVAKGGTVILTTHILEVAERLAQRIGIIRQGRLIAEGTLDELRARTQGGSLEDVFLQLTAAP